MLNALVIDLNWPAAGRSFLTAPHRYLFFCFCSNLQHLQSCCKNAEEVDTSGIAHPHASFMERAIELSRIAGIEKRTGARTQGTPLRLSTPHKGPC